MSADPYYIVEERVGGWWRSSPRMLDRLGRVGYSLRSDAEQAVEELCERTDDDPTDYRVTEVDGP